jgi:hypothetical protein
MHWIRPRFLLVYLFAGLLIAGGCNFLAAPFYLLGPEDKTPASMKKLASDDKDKEVTVLIWSWAPRDVRANLDISNPDRKLAEKLHEALKAGFAANKEKVTLIPTRKVDEYRLDGDDNIAPLEAGKHFKADYVIYLEVNEFSLSVPKSWDELLQGRAKLTVSLLEPNKPDEEKKSDLFECIYPPGPDGNYEMNETGNSKEMFAQNFLRHVARQLSWKFTAHKTDEDKQMH